MFFISFSLEIEDALHYLLHCHHFSQYRIDLMNGVKSVSEKFESLCDNVKKDVFVYGNSQKQKLSYFSGKFNLY